VHVVGGYAVREQGDRVVSKPLTEHKPVGVPILLEPEEELPVVAAMGDVIRVAGNDGSIGSWHVRNCGSVTRLGKARKSGLKNAPYALMQPLAET
jgi:hypothetical protein